MILFENCCHCIPLKTGCLVIGILDLIGSIIDLYIIIYAMIYGVEPESFLITKEFYANYNMIVGMGVIYSVMLIITIPYCFILLIGIKTDKPGHLKAYLIFSSISLILYAILLLVKIIHRMSGIIGGFVACGLYIYCLLVIRSYYVKMQQEIYNQRFSTESPKV